MARATLVALMACGILGATNAQLEVVAPGPGESVMYDSSYTVKWTGNFLGRFEIDLYKCSGSACMEDSCGELVTSLCPLSNACPDSQGDYDVAMPEPGMDTSGTMYKVRVADANNEANNDCSEAFELVSSSAGDGGFLEVTSPTADDVAISGEEYTIEWAYDNGFGSSTDRFSIGLYPAGCTGGMVANLCDKPSIGCKDSTGDYDVVIPEPTSAGMYSIRVARFEDDALFGCSEPFAIEAVEDDDFTTSMRF